ncbi:PQQ-binding-like beta-propeller repeat protein [soil metagenome]
MIGSPRILHSVIVAAVCSALPAHAQSPEPVAWPQFRGPNGSGTAEGALSLPIEFGPSKNLAWRTPLPGGHSSPAIWGNRIYLTAADTAAKKLEVIALDRSTGGIAWRQAVPATEFERIHPVGSLATSTPAVDGQRVYAYFGSYGLVAYDLNGKVAWEAPMPVLQAPFGSGTSPVVAGELVILNRQEPKEPFLIALDRSTGKTVWKHQYPLPPGLPSPYAGYATPLVVGQQVIVHGPTRLEAFDLSTGEVRWWVTLSSTGTSTPVVAGDTLYVATWYPFGESDQVSALPDFEAMLAHDKDGNGTLNRDEVPEGLAVFARPDTPDVPGATMSVKGSFARVDGNKDGEIQRNEWDGLRALVGKLVAEHGLLAVKLGGTGDVTATHVLWKENKSIPEVPSPLAYNNKVYLVRNGGVVTCLDAVSGKLLYRARVGAGGPYFASPLAANGRVIVTSGDGVVSVLSAGDHLDVLANNDLGEPVAASPAFVDGVLYVRTASGLSAFRQP